MLRGTKGPAPLSLPIHVIEQEDKTMECGPNIEDPFSKVNLGTCRASKIPVHHRY